MLFLICSFSFRPSLRRDKIRLMTDLPFLCFQPVPIRQRSDGWSPRLQRRFILNLARGMGPNEAARSLGRSRQSVYVLRAKPGAEAFAAAWDAALAFSQQAATAARSRPFGDIGIDALLVPRFYRGRLVGFVQREDSAGALRKLAQLDRVAQSLEPPIPDEADFAALLDRLIPGSRRETCQN